jgi:type IX secretion system PorP/SprF family membrane protein
MSGTKKMRALKRLRIISFIIFTAVLTITCTKQASAQLTGLQSIYFGNEYLANPAMAGLNKGLNLNLGYQQQWTTISGSPKLQDFTADYNAGNRVGLGFIINNDQSGLISRTRIMGTYAYHLPVSETGKLNFGLSAGVNDTYIDYNRIVGDQSDVSVKLFNGRSVYVDGDLGISYTDKNLNIQASIPNLGSVLFNTAGTNLDVDRATFFTAVSYQMPLSTLNNDFTLAPKLVFRGIKGFQSIIDAGFNLMMNNYGFNVWSMYHTNKSFTSGVGVDLKPIGFLFSYTNNTGSLSAYANNTFELGIKYVLFNK